MKSIKFLILSVAVAIAMTGCGSSSKSDTKPGGDKSNGSVVGEWHLISWSGDEFSADIYLSFETSGKFGLYQRLYYPTYTYYEGTYSYKGSTLTGAYSDGTAWGESSYTVSFADEGNQMKLVGNDEGNVAVYTKTTIPEDIIEEVSRSEVGDEYEGEREKRFL